MSAISSILGLPKMAGLRLMKSFSGQKRNAESAPVGHRFLWGFAATDEYIDEHIALSLSVVWACVMAIAEGLAASSFQTFTEDDDGNRKQSRGPLFELLNGRPNPEQSRFDFMVTLISNALIDKAGYAEIQHNRKGKPIALWPIKADRVRRERIDGELYYRVYNHTQPDGIIHHEDMICIRFLSLDGQNSLPIIEFARDVISRAKATRDFGASFYRNGTSFGGIFSPKTEVGTDKAKAYSEAIAEQFSDVRNSHGNIFLPTELDYRTIGIDPDKAQFIQTEQHLVEEICRYFRVPPHKVQHLLRATFNNIEHLGIEFVRDAVTPWAERLCGELNYKVAGYSDMKCRLDLEWLREGDAKSVAEAESTKIFSGQSNPDEARRRRGENPIPDGLGQRFVMQQSMTTLDKIGEDNGEIPSKDSDGNEPVEGGDVLNWADARASAKTFR